MNCGLWNESGRGGGGWGVGREVQSLVWRRVYEIADVIVCIPPSFRISRQILAKGVCAYCVHNTCATRGHEEKGGERISPMLLLNSYKNAMTELSGSVVSLNRCWSDFYFFFFFVFVQQRETSTRIFALQNVFLKPWIIKTFLYSRIKITFRFHIVRGLKSKFLNILHFFDFWFQVFKPKFQK